MPKSIEELKFDVAECEVRLAALKSSERERILEIVTSRVGSKEPATAVLIERAVRAGLDPHKVQGACLAGVTYDEVTEDQRRVGKNFNIPYLYGKVG